MSRGGVRACQLPYNADGTPPQFFIRRQQIHHQIAGHFSEADHRKGGDSVQDQFGGRPCLQARRAGQHFRAEVRRDHERGFATFGEPQVGIEAKQDGLRSLPSGLMQSAPNKSRRAAGGNAQDHIIPVHPMPAERFRARRPIVLRALHGAAQRDFPAGDDALHHPGGGAKRWRAFAGVQYPKPSTGTGADVEEPASAPERARHVVDRLADFALPTHQDAGHPGFLSEHQGDAGAWRKLVQVLRTWIAALGWRGARRLG